MSYAAETVADLEATLATKEDLEAFKNSLFNRYLVGQLATNMLLFTMLMIFD